MRVVASRASVGGWLQGGRRLGRGWVSGMISPDGPPIEDAGMPSNRRARRQDRARVCVLNSTSTAGGWHRESEIIEESV